MSETKRTSLGLALLVSSMYLGAAYLWSVSPGQVAPPVPIQAPSAAQITRYMAQDRLQAQYRQAEATLARQFKAEGCSDQYAGLAAEAAVDNHLPPRSRRCPDISSSRAADQTPYLPRRGDRAHAGIAQNMAPMEPGALRSPQTNIQAGTLILASYVRESGLREGLHRFNGLGDPNQDYSDRVMQVAGYR